LTAIYGHRGARGERPENTIAAFQHAASLELTGVECDVALTRDLVPVLHHDPEISQSRLIRDLSLTELHRLAPKIPTLAQALHISRALEWLIEIKTYPDAPEKSASPGIMAEAVLAVLQNAGQLGQSCILAFDWRVLAAVAKNTTEVRRICLTTPATERSRNIWWGDANSAAPTPDAVARTNAYGWAPHYATLTAEQLERAHRLGLKVYPWTVNDAENFHRLPAVDGIITDYPSRLLRLVSNCSPKT
jgi:glycerophosphoryl diester phosphodiesterase